MDRNLTQKERRRLERLHRSKRDKRHCDRIKAILLYDQGYRYTEIARILLLDDETIRRHVKDYFEKHKLMPENGGRDAYLTECQSIELKGSLTRDNVLLRERYLCLREKALWCHIHH